jgi:hypothetical protein
VTACAHRTNLGQQWLRPRKRRGTTACPEKAQIAETVYGAAGQGKTCTAKALLLEPQFAATNPWSGVAERLTRHLGWSGGAVLMPPAGRRSDVETSGKPACPTHPLYGGASERTGRLTTSHPPTRVIAGCPAAGVDLGRQPVWARSRHSTRRPGVMAGTAAGRPGDDRRYKRGATRVNASPVGGRAAASAIRTSNHGAC